VLKKCDTFVANKVYRGIVIRLEIKNIGFSIPYVRKGITARREAVWL
jgi:hypothetical protein